MWQPGRPSGFSIPVYWGDMCKYRDNAGGASISGHSRAGEPDRLDRFLRLGPAALAEWELLGWVLGPGGRIPADEAARQLLDKYGSLVRLARAKPGTLRSGLGLGPTRIGRLLAALELGLRAVRQVERAGITVKRSCTHIRFIMFIPIC